MIHTHPAAGAVASPVTGFGVALRPFDTYRRLGGADSGTAPLRRVAARAGWTALLVGVVVAVCATRRVTAELVLSVAVYWSGVPAMQVVAGSALIAAARQRRVHFLRALDLFLAGHVPWSLWLIAVAAIVALTPPPLGFARTLLVSALVPAVWTTVILVGFARGVLRFAPRSAVAAALLHQTVLWTSSALFLTWLTDSWLRIAAWFA